jgi:Ser/Thr protein kinase RdoA (MazF antagonist)
MEVRMEKRIKKLFNASILEAALDRFGVNHGDCTESHGFESFIFRVTRDERRYVLKISHGSRRSRDMILGEVDFINYLGDNGLTISRAIPSRDDALVEILPAEQGYFTAIMYEHAPGALVQREDWNAALFVTMGLYLGKLHALSKAYAPVKRLRPTIFEESEPLLRDFIPRQHAVVRDKVEEVMAHLRRLPQDEDSYGLIHVDFHRGNFFLHEGGVWLFDFDDCQYSWFAHDVAMALFYALPHDCSSEQDVANGHNFLSKFLSGYYQENELDRNWLKEIPSFLKLRELELYAAINRSFDLDDLDPWTTSFMDGRKAKIEGDVPYFELDVDRLDF